MFRIRRIYDAVMPVNLDAILQVQHILRAQFPTLSEKEISKLLEQLRNPLKYRFRTILFIAEDWRRNVKGFALLYHMPDLGFCYLDFISTAKEKMGRGIGGALYERVREEASHQRVIGLFFESLPDDPQLCHDPKILKQNAGRLSFYEKYGARPIINTAYESPLRPGDDCPPYLVYDDLGQDVKLDRERARSIVQAILERKYGHRCPADYINKVTKSFKDNPVHLREPRYLGGKKPLPIPSSVPVDKRIILVINDKHAIHHIRDRGYVESPVRVNSILKEFKHSDIFLKISPEHYSESYIKSVHDSQYVEYFKKMCNTLQEGQSIYPYVFPIRNTTRPPKELAIRAGYYCIDSFTPLNRNAYLAAKRAVDCALTAAKKILEGSRLAYALVRPPGHHAERHAFGGFCYFNSGAVAAHYLSGYGKVAILDIDYHHGNGQQNIFYDRADVLTVSLHGHPHFSFPYFSGFKDEKGIGLGKGFNRNFPLPENITGKEYRKTLQAALDLIIRYKPQFLIAALGLDTAKGDPTGTWDLLSKDFEANGRMIGSLQIPVLVVQEGGYNNRVLGINARNFFMGLWSETYAA
ncbi:hypothetical protein [[Eubacterium] cellulosolvens]